MTPPSVTGSMLYDLMSCDHRVAMDLFEDAAYRDEISPFVQMLWERGSAYEKDVIENLKPTVLDLSGLHGDEKERATLEAMKADTPLIYSGRIRCGDLLGEPDLLRREACGYVPGDIKSGSGEEGPDDNPKPKKTYGVQVALYADILEQLGVLGERLGFILDVHGNEVPYVLGEKAGPRSPSLWETYQGSLSLARAIIARSTTTRPAYAASCKLCHWGSRCMSRLEQADDLTLLPELGRAKRDALMTAFPTVKDFANGNVAAHIRGGKTVFQGIGPDTLRKLQERAQIKASNGSPYTRKPLVFPQAGLELFFDVETDPMQDVCYLHGFVVRAGAAERYVPFFADDKSQEEQAFRDAWDLIRRSQPCALYYYSPYERTTFRHLQEQYPNVCSRQAIDDLFASARSVDLYTGMVKPYTEWPTKDHSVKTLAKYLGFQWRDTNPSGAASIEWFSQWQKDRDPTQKQRILDYNEDDCIAMRVLLEGLRRLPVK